MKKNMNKKEGFSIIELLISLVVMAVIILFTLNIGRSAMQRAGFDSAVNQFVADYNYARQRAAQTNRYVAFVFNPTAGSYNILVQNASHVSLADPNNYALYKTIAPLNGEAFFNVSDNFAVSSTGVIHRYPVIVTAPPISINITFFKKSQKGKDDFQRFMTIFPYGGLKLTEPIDTSAK